MDSRVMKQGSCGYGVVAMGAQGWQMSSEGGENVDLAIFKSSTVLQPMDYEETCAFLEACHVGMRHVKSWMGRGEGTSIYRDAEGGSESRDMDGFMRPLA